ncbi:MAG: hypothetical protein WC383_15170, partial [Gammaproteobacteria bacterium]
LDLREKRLMAARDPRIKFFVDSHNIFYFFSSERNCIRRAKSGVAPVVRRGGDGWTDRSKFS